MCTRFTLGRTRDAVHAEGCALWFSEGALAVWAPESLEPRVHHLDTPSFSLSGDDVPARDERAMHLTHGSSKDHRPDLKPAGVALLGSQDGGVPRVRKRWEGNPAETQSFTERAEALRAAFASSPTPRDLVAEAQRSTADTAAPRAQLGLITRIAGTLKLVSPVITQALQRDRGQHLDETTRDDGLAFCHYGRAHRGLVVSSQAAMERAEASLTTAQQRAWEAIEKPLVHLPATRVPPPAAAHAALTALSHSWRDHQLDTSQGIDHKRDAGKGRPTHTSPRKALEWQMQAQVRPAQEVLEVHTHQRACCVIGTKSQARQVSAVEVIRADKAHSGVESGFRCLKDPWCFVSSLCVKKPRRIHGVLRVMTLALLVYALTQRRWRQHLANRHEPLPNPIHQPTERPTLRGVFQLLEGMHRVHGMVQGQVHDLMEGLTEVQINILRLFGDEVCRLYQIPPG
jgi:hypothetical protein